MIKSLPPQVPVSDWLLRNLWQKPIKAACALKITNQGSSFILSLPLNEKKAEEAADIVEVHSENEGSAENIPSEFSGKKFTVLLVEDNVELLNLTRDSLVALVPC